jgi:hypothetical protein
MQLHFFYSVFTDKYKKLPAIANNRIIFVSAALIGTLVTFAAGSRGPILAFSICTLLLLITHQQKNGLSVKLFLSLIFMITTFGVVLSTNVNQDNNKVFDRILAPEDDFDSSNSQSRGYMYDMAVRLSMENPLFGFGLELPNGIGYPHNIFIESFLTLGVGGGIIFAIINLYAVIISIKLLTNKNSQWGWIGLLFLQYMIAGCSSGSLYGVSSFWYFLFSLLSICDRFESTVENHLPKTHHEEAVESNEKYNQI